VSITNLVKIARSRVGLELVDVKPRTGTAPLALQPPRRSFVVAEMEGYEATEIDLPANISRRFLVAYHNTEDSDGGVELALKPRAVESKRDILPPGEYELTLALTASNTDATFWKTVLSFQGTPTAGEELPTKLSMTSPIRVSSA
jgi:hypothetical protein